MTSARRKDAAEKERRYSHPPIPRRADILYRRDACTQCTRRRRGGATTCDRATSPLAVSRRGPWNAGAAGGESEREAFRTMLPGISLSEGSSAAGYRQHPRLGCFGELGEREERQRAIGIYRRSFGSPPGKNATAFGAAAAHREQLYTRRIPEFPSPPCARARTAIFTPTPGTFVFSLSLLREPEFFFCFVQVYLVRA